MNENGNNQQFSTLANQKNEKSSAIATKRKKKEKTTIINCEIMYESL